MAEYRTYHRVENIPDTELGSVVQTIMDIVGKFNATIFSNKATEDCSVSVICTNSQWETLKNLLGLIINPATKKYGSYRPQN